MILRSVRWRSIGALSALVLGACDNSPSVTHFVLALSWQPAFCEFNAGRPECRALDQSDFAAGNLTIHGLWPNDRPGGGPSYCAVDAETRALDEAAKWCELPEPEISAETRADLAPVMPGIASCLDRHEWIKHGTCAGIDADAYFSDTLRLAEAVQATPLGQVIAAHVGRSITPQQLRNAFEAMFGAGSSRALTLVCAEREGRRYLAEIRIALKHSEMSGPLERSDLYLDGKAAPDRCGHDMRIDSAS